MAKDVVITPASGTVVFSDTGNEEGRIYTQSGNLYLDADGNIILGDGTPANIDIGDASVAVDFTFLGGGNLSSNGNTLNIGKSGDTINLNVSGVTYNYPSTLITTSDYTANDVLTKIKTVDGSGSGLDADLLDGLQSASINTVSTIVARDASGNFSAGTITASSITGSTTLVLNSTTTNAITLDSTTTGAVNIGNNANAKTITIGNITGATGIVLNSGTAGVTANMRAAGVFKIQASQAPTNDMVQITNTGFANVTAGVNALAVTYVGGSAAVEASAMRIDLTPGGTTGGTWTGLRLTQGAATATGVTVNVIKADNITAGAGTDNIIWAGTGYDSILNYNGSTIINGTATTITGSSTLTLNSVTTNAIALDSGTTGAVNIGTSANAKTITIGNGTGATSLVLNAGTGAINIGTNAIARTVTVGNTTGASALTLSSGTGAMTIDSITGAINVGTNANAKTITIGNGTGATSLVLNAGTGAINIGTNAVARTITVGNATGASALTLNSGTGAINIGTSIAKTITVGNTTGATGIVLNSGTAGVTANMVATGVFKVQASAAPTTDMVQITNTGFANVTAGVNALAVTYVGGAAAVEGSAMRIDLTPGATTGGTWSGLRLTQSAATATGVTVNVLKADTITTGAGTDNVLWVGTGYDSIINYNGTTVINGTGQVVAARIAAGTASISITGTAAIATTVTLVATNTTNAIHYPVFVDAATGNENIRTDTGFTYNPSTGDLSSTNFNSTSDIRKKENIETIENPIKKITNLRGVNFNWKDNGRKGIGVIAQEIENIIPEVVVTNEEGEKTVQYGNIVGLLIEAIKEQNKRIETLEKMLLDKN